MFDLDEIDNHFPIKVDGKASYRDGQRGGIEFILKAFNDGKKFVILEGPTGSGKSSIGMTVADMVENSYYLTATKILQDQLTEEFGEDLVELKGRNAYPCTYYDRYGSEMVKRGVMKLSVLNEAVAKKPSCAEGYCKTTAGKESNGHKCPKCFTRAGPIGNGRSTGDLDKLPDNMGYSACPYYEQVYHAINSRKVVMNFSSFLFQTQMTNRFDIPRDLLLLDECLHPHTRVMTEVGLFPIGKIVNDRMMIKVASFNPKTGIVEYKPIVRWLKRDKQLTYKVLAGNRILYPTADHKIYTPSGKKKLSDLSVGDDVYVRVPEITNDQKQLVLGSLLGDASLQIVESKRISSKYINKGTRSRVQFRHGPKQFDYIMWKYGILSPHARTKPVLKPSAGFTETIAAFATSCDFYEVIKPTLIGDKKSPNFDWLSQIDALGLAVWYMDDGGVCNDSARFNTHGFTLQENGILVQWLLGKWNIEAQVSSVMKNGRLLYFIQIGREHTRLLMRIIAKFVPPYMRYKLAKFVPNGVVTGYALRNPHRRFELEMNVVSALDHTELDWEDYDPNIEVQSCSEVSVGKIGLIEPYKETITYDLEVEDNHNYFAGNTLVSNCHNVESQLMDFVSLTISDSTLSKFGIYIPKFNTSLEYAVWFEDTKIEEYVFKAIEEARESKQFKLEDDLHRVLKKYKMFMTNIQDGHSEWVCEYDNSNASYRKVTLKPVFVRGMAKELLFKYADKVLLMSATILDADLMCRSLGIDKDQVSSFRMRNRFPVENRPIYIEPVAKMTGGKNGMVEWGPKLVKGVDRLVEKYEGVKGIIHTHNFAIQEMLRDKCSRKVRSRFLLQQDFGDKKEMLDLHFRSKDTIIVAPAMHEGVNLFGDHSRLQILCKVPFPNCFDDVQLARRVELDRAYYQWLVAIKTIQSVGRSVRSDTDFADTYILDESIIKFLRDAKKIIPSWFMESVIYK